MVDDRHRALALALSAHPHDRVYLAGLVPSGLLDRLVREGLADRHRASPGRLPVRLNDRGREWLEGVLS